MKAKAQHMTPTWKKKYQQSPKDNLETVEEIKYQLEERAGILEFDAGLAKSEAEKHAENEVFKQYETSNGSFAVTKKEFLELVKFYRGLKKQRAQPINSHLDSLEPKKE